jgi:hypothetical protein
MPQSVFLSFREEPLQMIAEDPLKSVLAMGRSLDAPAGAHARQPKGLRHKLAHRREPVPPIFMLVGLPPEFRIPQSAFHV